MNEKRDQVDSGPPNAATPRVPDGANDTTSLPGQTGAEDGETRADDLVDSTLPDLQEGCLDTLGVDYSTLPLSDQPGYWDTVPDSSERRQQRPLRASTATRRFGDYELISEIARGGMGVVYKARQIKLNRIVALKMILTGQLASESEVQRFHLEAEAAANLEHPGIIPIFEIGQYNGQNFFSMGFVEGRSLEDRLKDGPLAPREAAEITKRIAEAIAYAHQRNVIHRDLKPANILLDTDRQPKVTDFGLAKKTEVTDGLTATGQILGTPSFMAPEQAAGQTEDVGPRSDIYSIGAILYALVTGRPPFQSANVIDTLKQVIEQDPVPPRRLNAVIHADLETICLKCLSKCPQNRYQLAEDLKVELDRFLNGEPVHAKASTVLSRTWSTVLSETRHTEVLAMWSQVWFCHAAAVLVMFSTTGIVQWTGASPWLIASTWVPGIALIFFAVWRYRFQSGVALTQIEKQIAQVWAMFGVTAVLTGIVGHLLGLETVQLLPIVVLECGLAFCCMAAILGGSFYPIGIVCFGVALVMPVIPASGTTIFGVLLAIGLLIPAIRYSPLRRGSR